MISEFCLQLICDFLLCHVVVYLTWLHYTRMTNERVRYLPPKKKSICSFSQVRLLFGSFSVRFHYCPAKHASVSPFLKVLFDLLFPAAVNTGLHFPHCTDRCADGRIVQLGSIGITVIVHRAVFCDTIGLRGFNRIDIRTEEQELPAFFRLCLCPTAYPGPARRGGPEGCERCASGMPVTEQHPRQRRPHPRPS